MVLAPNIINMPPNSLSHLVASEPTKINSNTNTNEHPKEDQRVEEKITKFPLCDEESTTTTTTTLSHDTHHTTSPRKTNKHSSATRKRKPKSLLYHTQPRRSKRGNSSLETLAEMICNGKPVVIITGAGLSVSSGIRPFRGGRCSDNTATGTALWEEVVWMNATREAFRKDPLKWYNDFWLKYFPASGYEQREIQPSRGHEAIAELTRLKLKSKSTAVSVRVITQNVDNLHAQTLCQWDTENCLIEAHGRVGLYKCIPEEDSDTDSESDEDEDRPVKLGSRKKRIAHKRALNDHTNNDRPCVYEAMKNIQPNELNPEHIRRILDSSQTTDAAAGGGAPSSPEDITTAAADEDDARILLKEPPLCPGCSRPCMPQALLFDEGYHSHSHYKFETAEEWIAKASALVFVGTSFAVTITDVALQFARENGVPVYNFNLSDRLEPTSRLHAENVLGPADETLTSLLELCRKKLEVASLF